MENELLNKILTANEFTVWNTKAEYDIDLSKDGEIVKNNEFDYDMYYATSGAENGHIIIEHLDIKEYIPGLLIIFVDNITGIKHEVIDFKEEDSDNFEVYSKLEMLSAPPIVNYLNVSNGRIAEGILGIMIERNHIGCTIVKPDLRKYIKVAKLLNTEVFVNKKHPNLELIKQMFGV